VDLAGEAGGFAASGMLQLGADPAFEVEGRLRAFQVATLLTRGVPLDGPISGAFSASGRARDFRLAVDLTQATGRFVLDGRVRRPGGELQLDLAGRLESFRLGMLIGRPGMFVAPLSGPIEISGGGRQPFRVRTELAGPGSRLDLNGWLDMGGVPTYSIAGAVEGLNLQRALADLRLPASSVRGTFEMEGQGLTLETLQGRYAVDLRGSTVGGLPVHAVLSARAEMGILDVETLQVALPRTTLVAAGRWGLTRPAPEPLHFSFASTDLRQVAPLLTAMHGIEPRLTGSVQGEGSISGTVAQPALTLTLRGRNVRYEEWRAGTLALDLDGIRLPDGIQGRGTLLAENAMLPGGERLQTVRAELNAVPGTVGVGVVARRDRDTDLAASARIQFDGGRVSGVLLESLLLRVAGAPWQLSRPALIAWDPREGIEIEGLELVRTGPDPGRIAASGTLPMQGSADLRIELSQVDLDDLRRLVRQAPDVGGRLSGTVVLAGPVAAPTFEVRAQVENLRVPDLTLSRVELDARYTGTTLDGVLRAWQNDSELVLAEARLPMDISVVGAVPRFRMIEGVPLGGTIRADSLPVALLTTFIPGVRRGSGYAVADIRIQGTHDRPRFGGSMRVHEGSVYVEELGVQFQEIEARISTEGDLVRVDSLSVRSGGLALVSGEILMDDRQQPYVSLAATMNRFQPMRRTNVATVTTSGALNLTGRFPSPVLTGQLTINEGTIQIPGGPRTTPVDMADADVGLIGTDTIAVTPGQRGLLAGLQVEGLEVTAGEAVWLTSEDARIQLGGDLLIFRTGEDMRIYGELQTIRGAYTLRMGPIAREFDIQRGRIQFFGTPDLNPALDIVAANRVRVLGTGGPQQIDILVQVTGTLQQLQIELTSDTRPPLPESELLSLLIFGRPSHELGEQAGALAQEIFIQELLGGAVLGPLEQALVGAGFFDYVRIRSRPAGAMEIFTAPTGVLGSTAIEGGRQILPNLFWTLEVGVGALGGTDAGATWGTSLDWQITQQWSARWAYEPLRRDPIFQRTTGGPSHQMIFDVRRRWEYGFPPAPTPEQMPDRPEELVPPLPPAEGVILVSPDDPPPPPPPDAAPRAAPPPRLLGEPVEEPSDSRPPG
jgi:translocation and assembly module TamB